MKKILPAIAGVSLALVALTGCSNTGSTTSAGNQETSQGSAEIETTAYGDAHTWDSGVSVTVTGKFQKASSGGIGGKVLLVTTTVKNGSTEDVETAPMITAQVKAGDPLESAALTADANVTVDETSIIKPGETQVIQRAYGVPVPSAAKNVQIEVSSPDKKDSAIFLGPIT